eukprot:gene6045-8322_t
MLLTSSCHHNLYKLLEVWKVKQISESVDESCRRELIAAQCVLSDKPFPSSQCITPTEMEWNEEAVVCSVCFIFFASMLYGPFLLLYLMYFNWKICVPIFVFLAALVLSPSIFMKSACFSYISSLILKYFSYRGSWKTSIPIDSSLMLVAPPHGLFPVGNLLAIIALPRFAGFYIRGIAASAVLNFPIAGNMLKLIGLIDASRNTVRKHLLNKEVVGVSSGGIAEIFETNSANGTECIILKSRGGICKMAIQTGSHIIPCYLFGNSKAFKIWYDQFGIMQWISRKLRVSLVLFYGRWGLPIPFRTTVFGVCGDPIYVQQKDNPTNEEITQLLEILQTKIKELFDLHKASYGWEHVELIIK